MSATKKAKPIESRVIYKRRKTRYEHQVPHGGWKVAYADFVTAMMTFFLLMWLVNTTSDEQKQAMAKYFNPGGGQPAIQIVQAGIISIDKGGKLNGEDIRDREEVDHEEKLDEEDKFSFNEMAKVEITREEYDFLVNKANKVEDLEDKLAMVNLEPATTDPHFRMSADEILDKDSVQVSENQYRIAKDMMEIWEKISLVLEENPVLKGLADNIKIEAVPEGLRIQVIDQDDFSMFGLADTRMTKEAESLLLTILPVINNIPHEIGITGHTDSRPYRGGRDYSNWELSADRAQTARRFLVSNGFDEKRIAKVEGRADADPYIVDDPSDPRNRRISIVVLRFQK